MEREPLTPADCDLRDFPHMQLDVLRLRDSDLAAVADAEVFRAAVLSWCVAWHQVPAASLPDDDAALCRLLGYGRDIKGWQKIRAAGALRGYVRCSDGRLYHPVVAEKAVDAWQKKRAQRDRTEAARTARLSQRQSQPLSQKPPPSVTDNVTGSKGEERERRREESTSSLRSDGRAQAVADDPWFAEFWQAYPRKDDKGHARKAFTAARRRETPDKIIAGLKRYRFSDDAKFQPLAATWLNGERWNDQPGAISGYADLPLVPDPSGLLAWIAKQDTKDGEYPAKSGIRVPCVNGYPLEANADLMAETIAGAGGELASRPNWDALAGWCRDDLIGEDGFWDAIRRVAKGLQGPVRSLAVFDAAVREQRRAA